MFPCVTDGIIENLVFEVSDNLFLVLSGGLHQIIHIHTAVKVQTACQRFCRGQFLVGVYLLERYGFTHDVGFEYIFAYLHFNREHLHAEAVEHDKFFVIVRMEIAPLGYESVIKRVQPFTQIRLFLLFLPFFG